MKTVRPIIIVVLATFLGACGDDSPPPPPVDIGPRDTNPRDSATDAPDSAPSDGSVDAGDSSPGDGSMDGMVDTGPKCMPTDRCTCSLTGADCGGGCPTGTMCISNTCGASSCFATGGRCNSDVDCPATSTCTETDDGFACIRGSAGCGDSRECPRGFACETGACVDRRVPCINNVDCPWGYGCRVGIEGMGAYCEWIARPCDARAVCFSLGRCLDFDGDGDTECGGGGDCPMTSTCGGTDACGTDPTSLRTSCGDYGPCQTACNSGFTCVDAWGDGQGECVPTGGTCTTNVDCPERQVCAPPNGGGAPACQAGNAG